MFSRRQWSFGKNIAEYCILEVPENGGPLALALQLLKSRLHVGFHDGSPPSENAMREYSSRVHWDIHNATSMLVTIVS